MGGNIQAGSVIISVFLSWGLLAGVAAAPAADSAPKFAFPWSVTEVRGYYSALAKRLRSGASIASRRDAGDSNEEGPVELPETRAAFEDVRRVLLPGSRKLRIALSREVLLETYPNIPRILLSRRLENELAVQEGPGYRGVMRALLAHEAGHLLYEKIRDADRRGYTSLGGEVIIRPWGCSDEWYFNPGQPCARYIRDHLEVDLAGIWLLRKLGQPATDLIEGLRAVARWQKNSGQKPFREFELRIQALEAAVEQGLDRY